MNNIIHLYIKISVLKYSCKVFHENPIERVFITSEATEIQLNIALADKRLAPFKPKYTLKLRIKE